MIPSSLATFRILAPEFSGVPDAEVQALLSVVQGWISFPVFGARSGEAMARLAAHELAMQRRASAGAGGVGPVQSAGTGGLSVSYGALTPTASASDDHYRQTTHGIAYLALRDSRAGVGLGVVC